MTLDLELVAFSRYILRGGPGEQNSETGRKPPRCFFVNCYIRRKKSFMKTHAIFRNLSIWRTSILLVIFVCSLFADPDMARAAISAGYSEYYIPGSTNQLFQILKDIDNSPDLGNALGGGGVCTAAPCNRMHNVITISVSADNVTIYYDHWENGYGTGNTGNDETYIANKGDVLTFESANILVPRAAGNTCASTNPNGASTACYDGRDRIYTAGGAVSVAEAFWPEVTGTLFANAWEVYPIKPYQTDYTIPVGEDLSGAPTAYTDFEQAFVIVQGTQDGTTVQVDNPGTAGVDLNTTLNRGDTAQLFHINAGTTVHASAPVQVQFIVGQFFTGYDSDSRSYTAVPTGLWGSSYYSPVSGSGRGFDTDVFVINPTGSPLIINYQDSLGNGSFTLPANSTRSYQALVGHYVPTGSALYLESADHVTKFWAVGSVDTENADYNYGFTLLPPDLLMEEYYVAWAPGTTNLSDNGSPVFVTPTVDNTTIFVDFSPINGVVEATYNLDRIEMAKIFDSDNNNTGMHIWATNPIAVVWGEDPDTAGTDTPYIDAGYTILPLNRQWISTVLNLNKTTNPSVVGARAGQTSVFTLAITTDMFGISAVTVIDNLPPFWAYVPGTTTITLPGGGTISGASADPTVSGLDLTWDRFPLLPLDMGPNQTLTIAYTAITTGTPPLGISTNQAAATGRIGNEIFSAFDSATIVHVTAASIGNLVWDDADADGIQDAGESGIDNITVNLYDAGGLLVGTTITSGGGLYSFTELPPGDYIVEFVPPAGYSISPADQGGDDAVDSDADPSTGRTTIVTLAAGEINTTTDAGMTTLVDLRVTKTDGVTTYTSGGSLTYTIKVWNDGPNNAVNATFNDTRPADISSWSWSCAASGSADCGTTASGTGNISVNNVDLPADLGGNTHFLIYTINATISGSAGGNLTNTATVTAPSGVRETNTTNNSASDTDTPVVASIGGSVWNDSNVNGIQDAGESGIDNVTVNLYNQNGSLAGTTTTSGGGNYLFTGLMPGDYFIEFMPPGGFSISPQDQGGNDGLDSDADITTGRTAVTTLVAGENDLSWDAGLYSQQGLTKIVSNTNQTFTTGNSNVAIGEIITYQVSLVIPPGIFPNARLVDTMQRGLAFVGCDSISGIGLSTDPPDGFSAACTTPIVDDAGGGGVPIGVDTDRRVTFDLGTVTNPGNSDVTMVFAYRAVVLDIGSNLDKVPPVTLRNSASFLWGEGNSRGPAAAPVTVVESKLSIDKSVNNNFISVGTEVTFTLTGKHASKSHTDAFDVVVTDTLPVGFDFVPGSLTCDTGAQVTVNCSYNPVTRTITGVWPTLTRTGGDLRVQFKVIGNNLLVPGVSVTNVGNIEWTSLPGPVNTPQSYSPNIYSTERYYDPADRTGVNSYGTNDKLVLNVLGGGGGDDDEDGRRNRNDRDNGGRGNGSGGGVQGTGGFIIPITGFAPGRITDLSSTPVSRYDASLGLSLEIPVLKLTMPIVGAPLRYGTWDVNWLTNQAGWLEKTAFPGFPGNSVLTGHVTSSYGVAGPFAGLNKLQEGDLIFIHTFGQTQIYKVQIVKKVQPNDISVLRHQEKPWLTLLTCEDYDEKTNMYLSRVVVGAELIEVRDGNISGR
jgi:LPXTG-site transpeptidase (sortase) family protein